MERREVVLLASVILASTAMGFAADEAQRSSSSEIGTLIPTPTLRPTPTLDVLSAQIVEARATITALAEQEKKEKEIADLKATVTALQGAIKTPIPVATPGRDIIIVPVPMPPPTPSPDVVVIQRKDLNAFINKGVEIVLTAQPTQTQEL